MISIVTPTYNRAHTLPRLFDSLCQQTYRNFEWMVIDDGSTDDTPELLANFKRSAPFAVQVIQQANSGKHVAVNAGVSIATGEWVFIVDSDDALTPDAILTVEEKLSQFNSSRLVGLAFRKAFYDGQIIGERIGPGVMRLNPTGAGELFKGDLAYVFKKEAMLKHPFPVIPGEKFVPELYIWNKIGDEGDIYYFTDICIYLCEYLPDGYSRNFNANLRRNPRGFLLYYKSQISRETTITNKLKRTIRAAQCYLFILKEKLG